MGAKQSKRSVDISGKEAEGGGEVAAAGAGGEGRVEQLADADALKPQLNGDAHIQVEPTDKEKELDSGTPENEKDATTEKEGKEEDDKEKEAAPATNGETEPKVENGESTPTPEDGKKPKKEKVKKKWSLRSISFSRKDKPKQEKKQKDEEPKTNGEPEKVPEETAEAVPEAANEVAEEATAPAEEKDEKTPETPVTEPLTNGSSTPESAACSPAEAAPSPAAPAALAEPDQLPVNGLSIQEPTPDTPQADKPEETKPEPPAAETAEIVPAPDIPKEVCVERLPLLEPTPPPLPANPPPSSVASFAATTMAPELTDASLANTADSAIAPLSALPETKDVLVRPEPSTDTAVTELPENDVSFVLKESKEDASAVIVCDSEIKNNAFEAIAVNEIDAKQVVESPILDLEVESKTPAETLTTTVVTETAETIANTIVAEISEIVTQTLIPETAVTETPVPVAETAVTETLVPVAETTVTETPESAAETAGTETPEPAAESAVIETPAPITETAVPNIPETIVPEPTHIDTPERNEPVQTETIKDTVATKDIETVPAVSELNGTEEVPNKTETPVPSIENETLPEPIPESEVDISEADDCSLPPPPIQDEDDAAPALDGVDDKVEESLKQIPEPIAENEEDNHISNGVRDISPDAADDAAALKKKAKAALGLGAEVPEAPACNGGSSPAAAPAARPPAGRPPADCTPATLHTPQEPLPVSDKLADLIPEVPDVPELNTETLQETASDVAVAN